VTAAYLLDVQFNLRLSLTLTLCRLHANESNTTVMLEWCWWQEWQWLSALLYHFLPLQGFRSSRWHL